MGIRSWLDRNSNLYYRLCCFVLFFVAASASFAGFYEKSHFREAGVRGDWYETGFEQMLNGTAKRPYIYRRFLPDTINWIDSATPQRFKDYLYRHQASGLDAYLIAITSSPTAQNKVYFYRYQVMYMMTFGFVLLSVYAMYLVCRAMALPPPAAVLTAVLFILLMPYFQLPAGFSYDYVELVLMCVSVTIALKFEWYWLLPVAALGAWNKESFLLFVLCLYPFVRQRNSRRATIVAITTLVLLCGGIYLCMRMRYGHNAGMNVVPQFNDQMEDFRYPRRFLWLMDETYGLRVLRVDALLPIALIVWTVWRGWKKLSHATRLHAKIAAAINLPLFILFCTPGEIRDLSLLYVTFILIMALNLNEWIEMTQKIAPAQAKTERTRMQSLDTDDTRKEAVHSS